MILAVDIGNTTIGFCGLQRKDFPEYDIFFQFKMDNDVDVNIEELEFNIREKLQSVSGFCKEDERTNSQQEYAITKNETLEDKEELIAGLGITGIGISSVVPSMTKRISEVLKRIFGMEPFCITYKSEHGLSLEVEEPEKVGVDRLCDAAFAAAAYGKNAGYQPGTSCRPDGFAANSVHKDADGACSGEVSMKDVDGACSGEVSMKDADGACSGEASMKDVDGACSGEVSMKDAYDTVSNVALITVDLGTSTTINVIDEKNHFLGGSIMPGLETGFRALTAKAAQLSDMLLTEPKHFIGNNTKECMNIGVVAGMAGAIDGLVHKMEKELGGSAKLILTGGCARLVSPLLEHEHKMDAELLYKGIAYIYEVEQVRKKVEETRIAWSKGDALRDKDISLPENIVTIKDISYWNPDSPMNPIEQNNLALEMEKYQKDTGHIDDGYQRGSVADPWRTLDIYYPASLSDNHKKPVIVSMHGGGWFYGNKKLYRPYTMFLASYGFAVVNLNYRLSPKHKYPCGFLDVCHAMDFLAANAEKYGLDLDRLYLVGDSCGAQLVTQYCIMAGNSVYRENFWKLLEKQGYALSNLKELRFPMPKKIALNCGVYDGNRVFETDREMGEWYLPMYRSDFEKETFMNLLSYMDQNFPESYIMTSVNDGLRHHTEPMKKRIEELQIPHIYREFGQEDPADGHVFHINLRSKDGRRCNDEEMEFFGRN